MKLVGPMVCEAEAQKKRKAAKRKARKKDKESRQARWERKLSTFKKEKENKNEILFIDD